MLNVDRASVFNAKAVLRHGTADEVAAVERGEASVSATAARARSRAGDARPASGHKRPFALGGFATVEAAARDGLRRCGPGAVIYPR